MIRPVNIPTNTISIAALRWTMVMIFALFGIAKFATYEAEGVARIASEYWLFGWMYPLIGVQGASNVIGTIELIAGVMIALGSRYNWAGLIGGLMGMATFAVTLSFMLMRPIFEAGYGAPFLGSSGQFLIKDAVLFAACLALALDAARRCGLINSR